MYDSIPSLTIPLANPGDFLKGRIFQPPPMHKDRAKHRPLGQKVRDNFPPQGQLFAKIQQKKQTNYEKQY